jgi:hypothetical protein
MEDDLIASLTRQVKEDVIENYVRERRLVEIQIESAMKLAEETRAGAWVTGRRLNRLGFLMMYPDMKEKLVGILGIPESSYWAGCMEEKFRRSVRFIRVKGFTDKAKFRKLIIESYSRLHTWMSKYRKDFEELSAECRAVNANIAAFQGNFDLLAILSFLRNLDIEGLARKQILGENFTPKEMASLDSALFIRPLSIEKMDVPPPLDLPAKALIEYRLAALANDLFLRHEREVRSVLK